MPPALVALDLDGTLLTHDCRLPEAHRREMRALAHRGIQVCICTGRPLLTALGPWHELGIAAPMVCFNGAWAGWPGEDPFHMEVLPETDVRAIIAALDGCEGALCAYPVADVWVMDREIVHTRAWRNFYGIDIPIVPERFRDWRGPSCKMMVVIEPEKLRDLHAFLIDRLAGRWQVVVSQGDRIEILPRTVSKATGLERLAARLGVARSEVWAVGDAENDREMIAWAGHGCVMGQAPDRLRAIARHVLPGIQARGLAALPLLMERWYSGR